MRLDAQRGITVVLSAERYPNARPCPKCRGRELEMVQLQDNCDYMRCARCGWLGCATIGGPDIREWNRAITYERENRRELK